MPSDVIEQIRISLDPNCSFSGLTGIATFCELKTKCFHLAANATWKGTNFTESSASFGIFVGADNVSRIPSAF
jgi:hypothetical protein